MDKLSDKITQHIFDISVGKCNITEEIVNNETDSNLKHILAGLLTLHEDIEYKNQKLKTALKEVWDYKYALDTSAIIAHTDLRGNITYVNDMFCKTSMYSKKELIGQNQNIVNSGFHPKSFWKEMWQTIGYGETWKGKIKNKAKDGSIYWVYTTIVTLLKGNKPYGYMSIRNDITELIEAEELILKNTQDALNEKNILLKEIHHRVKNNLQVITSLLSLQSNYIDDPKTKELFQHGQHRINTMAIVHEMLYQSDSLSKIDYHDYLKALTRNLIDSFKGTDNNIDLNLEVKNIELNVDTAIPLGLLVNEIITNSLKHGILDNEKGSINISLKQLNYPNFVLSISDNGMGYTDDLSFGKNNSLGLKLINKLALQLNGNIEKDISKKGTHYILKFQEIEQTL